VSAKVSRRFPQKPDRYTTEHKFACNGSEKVELWIHRCRIFFSQNEGFKVQSQRKVPRDEVRDKQGLKEHAYHCIDQAYVCVLDHLRFNLLRMHGGQLEGALGPLPAV
jgi:hypothetical protein